MPCMLRRDARTFCGPMLVWALVLALVLGAFPPPAQAQALPLAALDVSVSPGHPRLMVTGASRFVALRAQSLFDATSARLDQQVRTTANNQLLLPVVSYEFQDSLRMTTTAKVLVDRAYALALAWRLTGDTRYMERLWQDLAAASAFPDWNPAHFIDTAEIANAFAIAYDWGYEYWTSARRTTLRNAMLTKAIRPALTIYSAPEGSASYQGWIVQSHNRNVVGNGGVGMAALAILDEDGSGDARRALTAAMTSIRNGLAGFASDGSYPEGPMYWEYASDYAVMFLNALQTATGSTHGLLEVGGLVRSGEFILDMMTASGDTYTYADSDTGIHPALGLSGLHRLRALPTYEAVAAASVSGRRLPQRLVLRDPAVAPASPPTTGRPRLSNYSDSGVVVMRADAIDEGGSFAALRYGGSPTVGHRQLDAGDFMISAGGAVWAQPLGLDREQYAVSGESTAPSKWSYYRNRAEGHNTVVFDRTNPDAYDLNATGTLQRNGSGADGSFAISDLSGIYGQQWSRGVRVQSTNRQVVVQDELSANPGTSLRWGMHTSANVELIGGGAAAVLRIGDQRMLAQLTSSTPARFRLAPAVPSSTSPNPKQEPNPGITKLFVDLPGGAPVTVTVTFTLLTSNASSEQPAPSTQPLAAWSVMTPPTLTLAAIRVDGQSIEAFSPGRSSYTVPRDPALGSPVVTATATNGANVLVTPITGAPGAYLVVTSTDPAQRTGVVVTFRPVESAIVSAVTSHTSRGTPGSAYDRNQSTGWATTGDQNIVLELRGQIPLHKLRILWTANQTRRTDFTIDVRGNSGTWKRVATGSYQSISGWMTLPFATPSDARYVRINVSGDPGGDRESIIREVALFGWDPEPTPPAQSNPPQGEIIVTSSASSIGIGELALVQVKGTGVPADAAYELVSSAPNVAQVSAGGVLGMSSGRVVVGAVLSTADWELPSKSVEISVSATPSTAFGVIADSYVEGGASTDVNFGSVRRLDIKPILPNTPADGARVRTSYLAFNLETIKPSDVETATLVASGLIADGGAGDAERIDAYEIAGSWSEGSITYRNRPSFGAPIGSALVARQQGEVRMDVTDAIRRASPGSLSRYSIAFGGTIDTGALMARLDSRESGSGARIEVTLKQTTHAVVSATAVGTQRGAAASTHDGSTSTGWAAGADGAVTWKLTGPSMIKTLKLLWTPDGSQVVRYRLLMSSDGTQWFSRGDFEYRGASGSGVIEFDHPTRATHVRVVLLGGSGMGWQATIREVELTSPPPSAAIRAPHVFKSVTVTAPTGLVLGAVDQIGVQARDLLGQPVVDVASMFTSSAPAIVQVEPDGKVRGVAPGMADITIVTSQGPLSRTTTVRIVVTDPDNLRLTASADTYVEGGASAATAFGTAKRLDIKPSFPNAPADGARVRHALTEFDLTGVDPARVRHATLVLQGSLIDDPQYTQTVVSVRKVLGPWSESGTTYQNRPELGDEIASFVVTRDAAEHRIDLTAFLQSQPPGTMGKVSFGLGGSVGAGAQALMTRFQSREAGTAVAPAIELALGPPPDTGPAPVTPTAAVATSTLRGTPEATFDGNESSGWATTGDQSITWALSRSARLASMRLLWTANTARRVKFEVTGSANGTDWVPLYDGQWTGASGWQDFAITDTDPISSVRLTVHGDPDGDRQSIVREVLFQPSG